MDVGELVAQGGHEQLVFAADQDLGLRLIVAIHSTALGPALGGIRFWHYASETDAVRDALLLSEAMTLKASIAGLDQGGGKAVCIVDDPPPDRSTEFLHAVGDAIHQLGGRYLAAEDVGASQADMDVIAEVTPWVTGVDPAAGGSGDPSPFTARGVIAAMRAACVQIWDEPSLAGRSVIVQGAGHVGSHVVENLVREGADVTITDVKPERAHRLVAEHGVKSVAPDTAPLEACDIFSPCALGGVVSSERAAAMRCRIVCGAANNQLLDDAAGDALEANRVLYVPDFVANGGGIINIAEEFAGYSRDRALAATDGIEAKTRFVLEYARHASLTPARAAAAIAWQRVREQGAGRRFMPGDAAAWTNGEPLTRLRPGS